MKYVILAIVMFLLNNFTGYLINKRDVKNKPYDLGQNILPDISKLNKKLFNPKIIKNKIYFYIS